jgi:Nickel-containing superoxide dismutase
VDKTATSSMDGTVCSRVSTSPSSDGGAASFTSISAGANRWDTPRFTIVIAMTVQSRELRVPPVRLTSACAACVQLRGQARRCLRGQHPNRLPASRNDHPSTAGEGGLSLTDAERTVVSRLRLARAYRLAGTEVGRLVKHHLWVLWTDYFKSAHFEKYP